MVSGLEFWAISLIQVGVESLHCVAFGTAAEASLIFVEATLSAISLRKASSDPGSRVFVFLLI